MHPIGIAGFFRYKELTGIQPNHIEFLEKYIKIFVPKSKTDIYREGNFIYIRKTGTKHCPVAILLTYMKAANIEFNRHAVTTF